MAGTEEKEAAQITTVHVSKEEKKKPFSWRLILIYVLLLAAGLFLGILFAYIF